MTREVDVTSDERERNRCDSKRPEQTPGEMSRLPELPCCEAGDKDVEEKRGGLHDSRCQAEECHRSDVAGGTRMTDGRIEERDDENRERNEKEKLGWHPPF